MGNGGVPGLRMHGRCSAMAVPARRRPFLRAVIAGPRIYLRPARPDCPATPPEIVCCADYRREPALRRRPAESGKLVPKLHRTHDKGATVTPDKHNGAHSARGEASNPGTELASFRALSEHDRQAINAIIQTKDRIKLAQAQLREDVKTVAERLGMKSSELNRIVRLVMQEQERGNALVHEKALIEVAEQLLA